MLKPTILIVEDSDEWQKIYDRALRDKVTILAATSIPEADALFFDHQDDIALVVMDACVPGDRVNTDSTVGTMRDFGFTNPIIATSSDADYRQKLMDAGCSHEDAKGGVPGLVLKLLNL